mmetsp:Transcript_93427/g.302471  ORF Transcript_93427/g.302471 Transcript_93427/m.302471 type:complete len:351 (+) Transcript_93427:3056-4108(+)
MVMPKKGTATLNGRGPPFESASTAKNLPNGGAGAPDSPSLRMPSTRNALPPGPRQQLVNKSTQPRQLTAITATMTPHAHKRSSTSACSAIGARSQSPKKQQSSTCNKTTIPATGCCFAAPLSRKSANHTRRQAASDAAESTTLPPCSKPWANKIAATPTALSTASNVYIPGGAPGAVHDAKSGIQRSRTGRERASCGTAKPNGGAQLAKMRKCRTGNSHETKVVLECGAVSTGVPSSWQRTSRAARRWKRLNANTASLRDGCCKVSCVKRKFTEFTRSICKVAKDSCLPTLSTSSCQGGGCPRRLLSRTNSAKRHSRSSTSSTDESLGICISRPSSTAKAICCSNAAWSS